MFDDATFRRLLRARELIRDGYAEPIGLEDLAGAAGLSRFHFLRLYRLAFGETPGRSLTRERLERARERITRGASVTDACFAVGFSSLGSFSSRFRREYACSPIDWSRSVRSVGAVPERLVAAYIPACLVMRFAGIAISEKPVVVRATTEMLQEVER